MKKTPTIIVSFLLLLLSINPLLSSAETKTSTTICVDDDNTGGPWDGSLNHPYQTIQEGVNASEAGDTVYVYEGLYEENVRLKSKSITVQGENPETTIVQASEGYVFRVSPGENVVLSGFTIRGAECGVILADCDRVEVSENIIYNNSIIGIQLENNNFNITVTDNIISGSIHGIHLKISSNNILRDNLTNDTENGIIMFKGSNNNDVIGNHIENSKYGVYLGYNNYKSDIAENDEVSTLAPPLPNSKNTLKGNVFVNNEYGLYIGAFSMHHLVSCNEFRQSRKYAVKTDMDSTRFINNNFIENAEDVYYDIFTIDLRPNRFINNYWDDWQLPLPKPIVGVKNFFSFKQQEILFSMPWVKFDILPALTPHEI